MRILLIEDDDGDVQVLREQLERTSIPTDGLRRVRCLEEAFELLQVEDFDLALLDLTLPDAEGSEGVAQLVEVRPELPIVVLTGHRGFAAESLRLGAQDYLVKDELQPPLLERSLDYACERKGHENRIIDLTEKLERMSERMAALAMSDPLTGLGNRRAFDLCLDEEIRRAPRQGGAVGLILVDVDCFKEVNDGSGHELGDRVLVAVGEAMSRAARRAGERAFRIGGDEFALVVACDRKGTLDELAERVVRIFAEIRPLPGVGMSLGSAVLRDRGPDARKRLLREADRALYAAKDAGGGRHVGADAVVEA